MTSRSRAENREYMRDYMRERRRASQRRKYANAFRVSATYDPLRDAPLRHADLTALMMGDPPIGRRAIDQQQARTSVRLISLAGAQA
jgi:hypothetical protein